MESRDGRPWPGLARLVCLAGLTSALGRERVVGAVPAAQADFCLLEIVATVRLGPNAGVILDGSVPGEVRGDLSFPLTADGAIDTNGQLRLEGGAQFPVVGQVTGRALNLRVDIAPEQTLILVGAAAQPLDQCTGDVDGLLTGPAVGDLGDWHATGTLVPGGEGPPPTATAGGAGATRTATATPSRAPTATAPAGATATATPAATRTPTPTAAQPTPTPVVCPAGTTNCGGVCVDLPNDPANCGACWGMPAWAGMPAWVATASVCRSQSTAVESASVSSATGQLRGLRQRVHPRPGLQRRAVSVPAALSLTAGRLRGRVC